MSENEMEMKNDKEKSKSMRYIMYQSSNQASGQSYK